MAIGIVWPKRGFNKMGMSQKLGAHFGFPKVSPIGEKGAPPLEAFPDIRPLMCLCKADYSHISVNRWV